MYASVKHPPTRKRVPDAELILRGTCGEQIKPIEFRSRPTKIIGERFYIYASQQWAEGKLFLEGCRPVGKFEERNSNDETKPNDQVPNPKLHVPVIGDNIEVPRVGPEPWMLELAKMLILKDLPTGDRGDGDNSKGAGVFDFRMPIP